MYVMKITNQEQHTKRIKDAECKAYKIGPSTDEKDSNGEYELSGQRNRNHHYGHFRMNAWIQ